MKSRRTRSGLLFAFGSGTVVRFLALDVQPRIPSTHIGLRTRYRVNPENSAGRKHFANQQPNLRSDSSYTRRTTSCSADQSSSEQLPASRELNPDLLTSRILAIILTGYSVPPPASAGSARLPPLLNEESRGFFSRRRSPSRARVSVSLSHAARGSRPSDRARPRARGGGPGPIC